MSNFWMNSDACWEWMRAQSGRGYGVLSFFKRNQYVHRISYRLFIGEIPNGMLVCHRCDNPRCFNPSHLFLGSYKDNIADMDAKGRRVSAPVGGRKNPNAKFSDETVLSIRSDFHNGICTRDLRSAYGISSAQLYRVTRYLTRPNLIPRGLR